MNGPTFGESLPTRIRREQDTLSSHMADALRYALMDHPPQPKPSWIRRHWTAFRYWLAWRLRDLSDWVMP